MRAGRLCVNVENVASLKRLAAELHVNTVGEVLHLAHHNVHRLGPALVKKNGVSRQIPRGFPPPESGCTFVQHFDHVGGIRGAGVGPKGLEEIASLSLSPDSANARDFDPRGRGGVLDLASGVQFLPLERVTLSDGEGPLVAGGVPGDGPPAHLHPLVQLLGLRGKRHVPRSVERAGASGGPLEVLPPLECAGGARGVSDFHLVKVGHLAGVCARDLQVGCQTSGV